jgi:hypothetical protein
MYSEARNQQGSTSGPTKKRLGTKERTNGANGLRRVYINRRLCLDVFLRGGRIKTHYDGTKVAGGCLVVALGNSCMLVQIYKSGSSLGSLLSREGLEGALETN